jgi:hypothetical protein
MSLLSNKNTDYYSKMPSVGKTVKVFEKSMALQRVKRKPSAA